MILEGLVTTTNEDGTANIAPMGPLVDEQMKQFKATIGNLAGKLEAQAQGYLEYGRYYQAQALFQGDIEAWEKWNKNLVRRLKSVQADDGSIKGSQGTYVSTTLSLLALAVNYRFLPIYER